MFGVRYEIVIYEIIYGRIGQKKRNHIRHNDSLFSNLDKLLGICYCFHYVFVYFQRLALTYIYCKYFTQKGVCKVLGTNFGPSIVVRGLRAPPLM